MSIVILVVLVLLVCFAAVLLVGAPYLPTLKPQIQAFIDLADLKPGATILELGSGDGRVLIAAANQGYKAVGYELNPLLVIVSKLRTLRYRKQVRVVWGNYWTKAWPEADAIYVFLLPKYMDKLDKKCAQYAHKPLKLVSFAFRIPGKKSDAQAKGLYLYKYT